MKAIKYSKEEMTLKPVSNKIYIQNMELYIQKEHELYDIINNDLIGDLDFLRYSKSFYKIYILWDKLFGEIDKILPNWEVYDELDSRFNAESFINDYYENLFTYCIDIANMYDYSVNFKRFMSDYKKSDHFNTFKESVQECYKRKHNKDTLYSLVNEYHKTIIDYYDKYTPEAE